MALVVRLIIPPLFKFEKLKIFAFLGRAAVTNTYYDGVFYAYIHNVRITHRDLITGYSPVETDSRSETITPGVIR